MRFESQNRLLYDSLQPEADEDPVSDLVLIPVVDQESHWLICEILLKKSERDNKWSTGRQQTICIEEDGYEYISSI